MHGAQEKLDHFWDGKLPVNVESIAKSFGVRIYTDDTISDCAIVSLETDVIVARIKSSFPPSQRRYIVAHQFGHYVLGHIDNPERCRRETLSNFKADVPLLIERVANEFASSLLMPEKTLNYAISHKGYSNIGGLAKLFGVSDRAMHQRLKVLKILPR